MEMSPHFLAFKWAHCLHIQYQELNATKKRRHSSSLAEKCNFQSHTPQWTFASFCVAGNSLEGKFNLNAFIGRTLLSCSLFVRFAVSDNPSVAGAFFGINALRYIRLWTIDSFIHREGCLLLGSKPWLIAWHRSNIRIEFSGVCSACKFHKFHVKKTHPAHKVARHWLRSSAKHAFKLCMKCVLGHLAGADRMSLQ